MPPPPPPCAVTAAPFAATPSWKHSAIMPSTTSCLNRYNTNPPVSVARKKLKILVLGGAGAGKTSILRRYFRGTFHQERIPTMGSDFYTRQVPNPSRRKSAENGDDDNGNNNEEEETDGVIQQQQQQTEDESLMEEKKVVDVAARLSPTPPMFTTADYYQQGKGPHHPPNAPSSYNPDDPFASAEFISIQVWDTPGRERFTGPNRHKAKYTAAFSDKFFQNANAALLVYDFTSSTSFTQLLHWHAELMERMQRLEETQQGRPHLPILIVANKMDLFAQQQQQQQQLLLQRQQQLKQQKQENYRNKKKNETGTNPNPQPIDDHDYYSDNVPQRDVMGFQGSSFRGKDSRYEYRASSNCSSSNSSPRNQCKQHIGSLSLSPSSSSSNLKSTTTATPTSPRSNRNNKKNTKKNKHANKPDKRKNRFEISTYMGTGGQTSYLKAVLSNECVRGSYLESLLSTEDRSHPDKDMVLLWCMRNGLKHVEVSALDGT
jgi:GTPase SAR1 family protein